MARGRAPATGRTLATTGMPQTQTQAEEQAQAQPALPQPTSSGDKSYKGELQPSRMLRSTTRASAAAVSSPSPADLVPASLRRRGLKRRRDPEQQVEGPGPGQEEGSPSNKRAKAAEPEPEPEPEPVVKPLSKANLKEFLRLADESGGPSDDMAMDRKRSVSRQSSSTGLNQETESAASQKSSYSAANYRWGSLANVRIVVQKISLPDAIRARVTDINKLKISKADETKLRGIAHAVRQSLLEAMNRASKEDDSVEPILHALGELNDEAALAFTRKADWNPDLKPNIPRKTFHLNLASESNPADHGVPNPPSKRQQPEAPCITPDRSDSAMPPPALPPLDPPGNIVAVKTPRPDITVGFRDGALIKALNAHGILALEAEDFLEFLHSQEMLSSCPLQTMQPLRFPCLVVEGKSYTTGRAIFEAQNQAAVSGSCMTNMQHKLADLVARTSLASSYQPKDPLAFSICTEGPIVELWVHYTTTVNGVRLYHMNILRGCHAAAEDEGLEGFIMAVYRVMSWARSELLTDMATQLALVKKTERHPVAP